MPGPGEYVPDPTEGVEHVEDLPEPHKKIRRRDKKSARCPDCNAPSPRRRAGVRTLHDFGNIDTGRPVDIEFHYSVHRCPECGKYFSVDMSDVAAPHSHYTGRVVLRAVRYVVEDGSPYRDASWRLWRDHRVFVPFATIQNWVEAAGEKNTLEN